MESEVFYIVLAAAGVVTAAVGFGLKKLRDVKIENKMAQEFLYRAADAAQVAVDFVHASFVKPLKAAAEDGKLTAEEAKEAARIAGEVIKSGIGPVIWKAASKSGVDVELVSKAAVESALIQSKK